MWKRICTALIGLTVSLASFGVSAAILPPPPTTKTALLIWDYPTITPEIVFNVYQTTNLSDPRSILCGDGIERRDASGIAL
jgi:hypothetical protein